MQRFTDKVVLITGTAEGMGRAITLAFAREGAIVIPTDINTKLLAETVKEASELSGRPVDWFKMDVTRKDEIEQTVKAIMDKHGRIDVLVNNAGVSTMNPVVDMTEEECGDLPICRVQDGRIISCWELTDDELMEILQTKRVWLSVWSGATQPPVCVQGETPFIMKK